MSDGWRRWRSHSVEVFDKCPPTSLLSCPVGARGAISQCLCTSPLVSIRQQALQFWGLALPSQSESMPGPARQIVNLLLMSRVEGD